MSWRTALGIAATAVALLVLASASAAETGWVRGAPLNLRSGAGTEFRILAAVQPGQPLDILERDERWTRVRTREGKTGWISAGYLSPEAPPVARVTQLETEVARLRSTLEGGEAELVALRESNASLEGGDSAQRAEIERLSRIAMKARWAEWFTGALILSAGMVLGAILSRTSSRRRGTRLRL